MTLVSPTRILVGALRGDVVVIRRGGPKRASGGARWQSKGDVEEPSHFPLCRRRAEEGTVDQQRSRAPRSTARLFVAFRRSRWFRCSCSVPRWPAATGARPAAGWSPRANPTPPCWPRRHRAPHRYRRAVRPASPPVNGPKSKGCGPLGHDGDCSASASATWLGRSSTPMTLWLHRQARRRSRGGGRGLAHHKITTLERRRQHSGGASKRGG